MLNCCKTVFSYFDQHQYQCWKLCLECVHVKDVAVDRLVVQCRLARMVQHPAVADVSKALWSFASESQIFLDSMPQFVGRPFGDLALMFGDGLVLGLLNRRSGQCEIAPIADTRVRY